ncbi:MAG: site-2 protease family protein [Clostridia bacterium]|nr:site-2 protease family protein [Clostridia bacterium]
MLGLIQSGGSFYETLTLLAFYVIAMLSALILHEVAHGLVALWCGDPSAKFAGRLSLNPAKHLDGLGTVCFLLFGFGWAMPVPINPQNFKNQKKGCILVSLAGIAVNLLLAFVASFFYVLLAGKSVWENLFIYIMLFNLVFATFNVLPIAPFDGFNLVQSLAPNSAYVNFMRQNRIITLIILVVVIYFTDVLGIMQNWLCGLFLDFWQMFL